MIQKISAILVLIVAGTTLGTPHADKSIGMIQIALLLFIWAELQEKKK